MDKISRCDKWDDGNLINTQWRHSQDSIIRWRSGNDVYQQQQSQVAYTLEASDSWSRQPMYVQKDLKTGIKQLTIRKGKDRYCIDHSLIIIHIQEEPAKERSCIRMTFHEFSEPQWRKSHSSKTCPDRRCFPGRKVSLILLWEREPEILSPGLKWWKDSHFQGSTFNLLGRLARIVIIEPVRTGEMILKRVRWWFAKRSISELEWHIQRRL